MDFMSNNYAVGLSLASHVITNTSQFNYAQNRFYAVEEIDELN